MYIYVTKYLSDFPVTQWSFIYPQVSCYLCLRTVFRQKFFGSAFNSNGIVGCIEYLKSQSTLLNCKITNLA